MRKRHHTLNKVDLVDVANNIDNVGFQLDINIDNFEAIDNSTTQENSPGLASGSSRKKQKINSSKEKDSDLVELKEVMYEVAQAINVGNQAMIAGNEALKEANEIAREKIQIARETLRNLPQLSGKEIWKQIQDCGFSTTNVTNIYRVLMGDSDLLKTFVEYSLLACKNLLLDVVKDLKWFNLLTIYRLLMLVI